MNLYEKEHIKNIALRNRTIERTIDSAVKDLSKRYTTVKGRRFSKVMTERLEQLHDEIEKTVGTGIRNQWMLANEKNNKLIDGYLPAVKISDAMMQSFRSPNLSALDAFLSRTEKGMNLSDRVWNFTEGVKEEMESLIARGVLEGKSAITLSKELKGFIKGNPIRYEGALIPGKNLTYQAIRVAATEMNMAFRSADYLQNSKLPFVTGVTVHLSSSHPENDICDSMQGEYPKNFQFIGWHPNCICYATFETMSKEDFVNYIKTDEIDTSNFTRDIPNKAKAYIEDNGTRLMEYENVPYWLKDNFTQKLTLKKSISRVA
jgi:hypothetical protein